MTARNCRKLDDDAEITKMNNICGVCFAIGAAVNIIVLTIWLTGADAPPSVAPAIFYWCLTAALSLSTLTFLIALALTPRITKWQIDDLERKATQARYRAAADGGL